MAKEPKEPLTPREEDVLALLRRGLTNAQLASDLGISENTAKDHVSSILHKLSAKTRDEAAYWPDNAPWWARAPLIAPLALFLRRSAAHLPFSPSMAATVLAGTALIAVIAGLSLLAFLVIRTDGSATPDFVSNDIRDLEPGMTVHLINKTYRRYGPAADIYAEHFLENGPETLISETWMEFDVVGNLRDYRGEMRLEDGTLYVTSRMDGTAIVTEYPDGIEQGRIDEAGINGLTVDGYKEALASAFEQVLAELEEHPDAPLVTLRGAQLRVIEERSPTAGCRNSEPSANSFSAPYTCDLQPVERIRRHYYSPDVAHAFRSEVWVVDADGVETVVEYSDTLVHEVLKN